jgi:putative heme-binding domain-containing protein
VKNSVINLLVPQYPAERNEHNRLLSKILVFLESPSAIAKTVTLLETPVEDNSEMTNSATDAADLINRNLQYGLNIAKTLSNIPPEQHTYYAMVLSQDKTGWTPELRERYFAWYREAFNFQGGMSYIGFINNARKAALSHVPKEKFEYYNTISGDSLLNSSGNELAKVFQPKGPGKRWRDGDISDLLEGGLVDRNYVQGKNMYTATTCALCHSMNGKGGTSGPDLTALGTRFSPEDILSSIIDPSKVISDQFASVILIMKDGTSVVGRIIDENDQLYMVSQNPFAPDVIKEIPKSDVESYKLSEESSMPSGLINRLNKEEIKDLLAFLISGGQQEHTVFQ